MLSLAARYRLRLGRESVTNRLFRSTQLQASPWTTYSNGVGAPVVTGNAAIAPNGLQEAARLEFPAIATAGHFTGATQQRSVGAPFPTSNGSLYLKGAGGGETVYPHITGAGGATFDPGGATAVLTTSWQRFDWPWTSQDAGQVGINFNVGIDLRAGTGHAPQPAQTVYAWGGQVTTGTGVKPHVRTEAVEATSRIAESDGPYDSLWQDVWPVIYPHGSIGWEHPAFFTGRYSQREIDGYPWNLVLFLDDAVLADTIRLEIDDTGNADGFVEAGLLEVSPGWQASVNFPYGSRLGWELRTEPEAAEGGVEYADRRPKPRRFEAEIPLLPENEALASPWELARQFDRDVPFLFVPRPGRPAQFLREAFLARLDQPGLHSFASPGRRGVPLSFVEVLG